MGSQPKQKLDDGIFVKIREQCVKNFNRMGDLLYSPYPLVELVSVATNRISFQRRTKNWT